MINIQWSKQFEWILNKVHVGVHVVDKTGTTVFYNQTMAEIDGLDRKQVLGKSVFQLYPSLTYETSTFNLALTKGQETVDVTQTYVNMKGMQITTINSTYPLYDGETIIGAVETAKDITRIRFLYDQTLELRKQLVETKKKTKSNDSANFHFHDLIGSSSNFQRALMIAKKAARSISPVMITGATGTGKELIAQSIHNASIRRDKPFVALNCAAVPKELMEGLLFGTTKGAFTGAIDRPGIFEEANQGTLFLDELNSLDFLLQGKLLRILQDGKIRRIGAQSEKKMDVRIITAMNIHPEKALEQKILREDLFYRLNVVHIEMPSLVERKSDIRLLANHFIKDLNHTFGCQIEQISNETLQCLLQYPWPGNIRELAHAIESAFNMIDFQSNKIEPNHLPAHISKQTNQTNLPQSKKDVNLPFLVENFEKEVILRKFLECHENISKTAKSLGITRQALQYKLIKFDIKKQS